MTITFIRSKECVVNYFVYSEFNGQNICFCNWNVLTGPPAGIYTFTGPLATYYNQLLLAGILFCPSEAVKIKRILATNPITTWTVV